MNISNIDDILMSAHSHTQPATPEHQEEVAEIEEVEQEEPEEQEEVEESESNDDIQEAQEEEPEEKPKKSKVEYDDYGNEKEPENEAIRDRLARQARKHQAELDELRAQLSQQGASKQVQQAAQEFEYNPDESGDWQQQLASFVKQTVNSMSQEEKTRQEQHEEAQYQAKFETKFRDGMSNFSDFTDVISGLGFQISNPMTLATRAMENPAAFLYAAAKRNPQDLERISKIRDPYVQMTEMGKLEERMRKNKPTTKAPRPLGNVREDVVQKAPKKEEGASGDDLLAKADAKRLSVVRTRHKGNR